MTGQEARSPRELLNASLSALCLELPNEVWRHHNEAVLADQAALVAERDWWEKAANANDARAEQAVAERDRYRDALIAMRNLASASTEGDPWYAERAGIDAEAVFEQARAALAVSTP